MAGQVVYCPHMVLRNLQIDIDLDVIKEIIHCGVCNEVRQDLWLCLFRECFVKVCCATGDHRIAHQKKNKKHCLFVAVRTMRVWCTTCNGYVLLTGHNRQSVENTKPQQSTSPANNKRRNFDSIDNAENSDDETASTSMDDNQYKPTGLTGLQNIGNTCYMNAALQALSNTPPLTEFFLSCGLTSTSSGSGDTTGAKKMLTLSKSYHRLMQEIWDSKGRGYVAPTGILYGIRNAHPMFRGYHQHDTQEFLRCFMDLLHEELKVAISEPPPMSRTFENVVIPEQDDEDMSEDENADASVPNSQLNPGSLTPAPQYGEPLIAANDARPVANEGEAGGASSQSEGDEYETCDSGVSERSSLSEETTSVDTENNRSLSSSPSPLQGRLGARNGSSVGTPRSSSSYYRKKVQVQYRSIISDVFDGKLLSSVQCLTCNRISTRIEAFQDLSLPIPSRDHLHMLHQGSVNSTLAKCTELYSVEHGWLTWIREWLCSLFWGPAVSLHDCLAAFFSADELKGDNMYSCEKCNKLRNGVKFSKVLQLPEVLCIHLKRFRHDLMYSSKINSHVTFPLEGLELRPYLHKHCVSQVTQYDLISVICHHGAAGSGGHYTCYALNNQSDHWYEFDDQCVTRVSSETVRTCEAYVLFYRKRGTVVNQFRHRASNLKQRVGGRGEPVGPVYAISKQWINRFNTFAEPGPIDNSDFLCHHGRMLPGKEIDLHNLTTSLPAPVWDYIYEKFGGGPICTLDKLALCEACNNNNVTSDSQESNLSRLELEIREFSRLEQDLQRWPSGSPMNAIWLKWFVRWNAYVKGKSQEPPGPIDNGQLLNGQNRAVGQVTHGKDYRQVSKDQWDFLQRIYGGGPEVLVKLQNNQSVIEPVPTPKIPPSPSSNNNSSETEIVGDNTYSSGNWSVASSVVDNSQAGDYSHPQIPGKKPSSMPTSAVKDDHILDAHVTDPVDPHQSTHGGGDWAPSLPNQERSSPISMDVDDIELTDMTEPVSETVDSGKPVSTSLLDIRIDSTQPSNVQTTSTDSDSNTTPVHPIHSSMPTVAQEGKASDKPTDSPSASGVC